MGVVKAAMEDPPRVSTATPRLRQRPDAVRILDPLNANGGTGLSLQRPERRGPVRSCSRRLRPGAPDRISLPRSPRRRINNRSRPCPLLPMRQEACATTVIEDQASPFDHTEKMLAHFGAELVSPLRARGGGSRSSASRNCVLLHGRSCRSVVRRRSPSSPP